MRQIFMSIFTGALFLLLQACTGLIADFDLQDEWEIAETGNILLHYRPQGFSDSLSPSTGEAERLAANQQFYLEAVADSLNVTFTHRVAIYLYNQDEAEQHIGTSGGGHCIPKLNTIYYTCLRFDRAWTDRYGIVEPVLGAHEMVHVVSHQALGYPGTKLMSEGYANWLDGSFARYDIQDLVTSYRDNHPERILTPDQLLDETGHADYIYYPNAGVFTGYLVSVYGIDRINRLFNTGAGAFRETFEEECGTGWDEMQQAYAACLENLPSLQP